MKKEGMTAPAYLNGYPVIRYAKHENCITVLVEKPSGELVVATWWPALSTTWSWGHYFTSPEDRQDRANCDFCATSDRNARR